MTTQQLINALSKCDPNATVLINIRQSNRAYGRQIGISSTVERDGYEAWVDASYMGATISINLPDRTFISGWPTDQHGIPKTITHKDKKQ